VLVSWDGLLKNPECADSLSVRHYKGDDTDNHKMSGNLLVDVSSYVVQYLEPNQEYTYQIIARKEKGLLGVDYHKGSKTIFTTSTRNQEVTTTTTTTSTDETNGDEKPDSQIPYIVAGSVGGFFGLITLVFILWVLIAKYCCGHQFHRQRQADAVDMNMDYGTYSDDVPNESFVEDSNDLYGRGPVFMNRRF
jgi:hypothetical protein